MSIFKPFLLNCYTCAVSRLELDVLLYSLTATNLLLAKIEDSNELVERFSIESFCVVTKVVEVFPNELLALSVALSVGLLHLCCGLVAAFKPIHEDGS